MQASTVWFTAVFIILLLAAFIFGTSAIFRQLKATEPATPLATEATIPAWQTEFPLLP